MSAMRVRGMEREGREARLAQVRGWMSPLHVHVAAAGVLLLGCLYLLVQLFLAGVGGTGLGGATAGHDAVAAAQVQQAAAEIAARPLRGLDAKLEASQAGARLFYEARLPFGYADVAAELGALRTKTGVRLSRVQYVQAVPVNGLTEIRMDAAVTGEYRALALFLNGLERDRVFFLIQNVTLNGAQNGLVSLRLHLTTYVREPMPAQATAQTESGARP